jgi:hypothetical protein
VIDGTGCAFVIERGGFREAIMTPSAAFIEEPASVDVRSNPNETRSGFRLQPIVRQGTPSSIAGTWVRFATLEDARKAVKEMYRDDRVLRVVVVTDEAPPRFVEWIER